MTHSVIYLAQIQVWLDNTNVLFAVYIQDCEVSYILMVEIIW